MIAPLLLGLPLLLLQSTPPPQQPGREPDAAQAGTGEENPSAAAAAAPLRERIHTMRRDLLTGGKLVRNAEDQAVQFYRSKMDDLDRRADSVAVDMAEKKASYSLALDHTLDAKTPEARAAAAREASRLKIEIGSMEAEIGRINKQRDDLAAAIQLVEDRARERDRLAAEFDASGAAASNPVLVSGGIGLAPGKIAPKGDPLADPDLLDALIQRDPERARALVFQSNPKLYWQKWPLTPPGSLLRKSIRFPLGDVPGNR